GGLSQGGGLEKGDVEGDSGLPRSLLSRIEPYGNSQRKPRSSAFPSSLTWDSDSEKETFDEELQHFSNPHGLAAHSPGSPTCGQEQDIDCGVYQTPEAPKDLLFNKDLASPLERRDQGTKPKEGYQKQEDERKEEKKKLPERDVYSFPGDSDPESPPPGPWAHCTFIQRRRKKRALLRPFSGLNTWQRTTGANRKTRLIPARTKSRAKVVNDEGGVFEFKEEEDEDEDKVQEAEIGQGQRGDLCQDIFTCVECSIYFKRRAHLREHMREHVPDGGRKGQGGEEGVRRRRAKKTGFECMECGQEFSDRLVLVDHHRRHQEARRKILEEIGKLNEGGTGTEEQANRRKPRRLAAQEPSTTPVCGQFVCLKCNYSSDVPQELADHAKTHTTRAKAGSPRAGSPRAASPKAASPKAASPNDGNEEDEDDEEEEDDEDVFSRLLDALTEEEDEEDEEGVSLKSVGRKCPYCPDRFDNGIGLANHIRGHLNRVGVSYNVRHFISPEEVNAIEKKFSYQKKKKKANFDPSTFSVMRCEFCSAGFDTRAGLSSHARAHLRDFGITNWEVTVSPINVLRELFSKRPDLALSTTLQSDVQKQDPDKEEEEEEPVSGKDEEGGTSDTVPEAPTSPAQPWKEERNDSEPESGLHKCDVCSATFETRRGLSSHARSHLRQLGVGVSESSGAPIDLLYQITKERTSDSETPDTPLPCPPAPSPKKSPPSPVPTPAEPEEEPQDIKPPLPLSVLGTIVKVPPSPSSPSLGGSLPPSPFGKSRSPSPSPVLRKAPISSLLPVSSPLRSQEHKAMCRVQTSASLSTPPRPFWAPQDSDAPLNLMEMDPDKDITCKLCGAWFETRKGLSSHARAHLRHFGVEYSESKGSPIDLLNRLILTDDFKHRVGTLLPESPEDLRVRCPAVAPPSPSVSTPTSSASKRPLLPSSLLFKTAALSSGVGPKATSSSSSSSAAHALLAPPTKKLKPSPQHVFRLSGRELMPIPLPMKDVGCEFCGELFENRKGLSSHARSHLRQLGITEWSVNGSPIDTLRELIARRGLPCVTPLKPIKLQKPLKPLKSPSSSPGLGPPRASLQSSTPQSGLLGRLPFSFTHPPGQHQPTARKQPPSASATSPSPTLVLVKPKPEPEPVEVTITEAGMEGCDGYGSEPLHCSSWSSSGNVHPINLIAQDKEPSRDIRCEFCGEFFENRKGLSSHARSHLRHMGITEWSVNGSPIDTLWEIMRKQGTTPASVALGVKEEPGRDGSPSWDTQAYQSPKVSRKSPLNLLHSGSRLHKHGLATTGLSATPPAGKFFGMAPVGKRVVGSEGHLGERSQSFKSKTFSPPPPPSTQDFSYKAKASTDKHGVGHMASCELCGFFFENRKALASHARAHLRQFGVTEWCVNGSPIETLSAWMRSRPQTVAELHRTYLQGGRSVQKKRSRSSLSPSSDSDLMAPLSQKSSGAPWSSLALSQGRAVRRDALNSSWGSSQAANVKIGTGASSRHGISTQGRGHHSNSALPHVQVARSELNVRVPRIERRPLKHPSHADGGEKESCPPKPPRSSTVPALVPKPPSTPLVKLVGKIYSLKCFCDVEFHGPLSVQEDWIRHLQQHILNLNYNKPAPTATNTQTKPETAAPQTQASATTSSSSTTTTTTTTNNNTAPTPTTPAPANTPTPTSTAPPPLASPGTPPTAEPLRAPAT
uniref:WIZ zinc finger b n=1 Tax=Astyanax mexicanus TaxID=7994 RepID=A0A3B1J5U9_ASTMX